MTAMLTLLTGFIASVAHVVTGPDHLAAVTPWRSIAGKSHGPSVSPGELAIQLG